MTLIWVEGANAKRIAIEMRDLWRTAFRRFVECYVLLYVSPEDDFPHRPVLLLVYKTIAYLRMLPRLWTDILARTIGIYWDGFRDHFSWFCVLVFYLLG